MTSTLPLHTLAPPSLILCALLASCAAGGERRDEAPAAPGPVIAVSLLGEPLTAPAIAPERRTELEANLAQARAAYERNPRSEEAAIWYGRRLAYVGRYDQAIDVYTRALVWHPRSSRLHRHRGHRFISTRQLDLAVADLQLAADLMRGTVDEIEPDGAPNSRSLPRSTHQSNVWYHLGLAHYLRGDYDAALQAYRECVAVSSVNDDMLCATLHWHYMTLRRLGRDEEARASLAGVHAEMDVIENHAYFRLLLMYRGELTPEDVLGEGDDGIQSASAGYGVGNWYLVNGDRQRAFEVFREILAGGAWAAFGYIAAEAELARAATYPGGPDPAR